jgi:hypothetical protein
MKRVVLAAASAAALGLMTAPALAQVSPVGAYGTLGYSHVDAGDAGLGTAQARLGYKFAPNFGVEGEGALGVDTDEVQLGASTYDVKVKRSLAGYAVGFVPLAENFELFGRVGYGNTKMKAESPLLAVTSRGDSWNYGGGAQYFFDGVNGVRADYTRHDFRQDRGAADVWGMSYVRRF